MSFGLSVKESKGPEFDKMWVKNARLSKPSNYCWGGKSLNFKEERFPQRRRGRQAVSKWKECWSWS